MTSQLLASEKQRDLLTRPWSAILWWGLPLVAGWSADAAPIAPMAQGLVWAVGLTWMGAGCALNARRCHRLHCYLAAPVLLLGAIGTGAVALGFAPFGVRSVSYVINTSLALALLSFLAEPIWGRYRAR
jgi:hypothetical protein